jgi:hypothetical protein
VVSLVDIVPQTRSVQIAAGELELHGLSLRQIADLLLQFPSLRNLTVEGAPEVGATELIMFAPEAIATIIAAAADQPDAVDAIASGAVSPDEAIACLTVIGELTFPRGIGPLALMLVRMVGPSGPALDTSLPRQPSNSSLADTSPMP